ncbi:Sensor histidine kinase RcsC [Usitatibacter rugosus]|uniref:histidine kinase n=1 Tax=Usitatibacter rugosus TaxID=2732067 RepID=A0A6M4GVV3_9PROT|nr:PAS domain-containing sensor histidine kinase [Usitatibacter rugosus]QJR11410.1 Sensor histidine kinase RcsC [Usitatibacter rugosus]
MATASQNKPQARADENASRGLNDDDALHRLLVASVTDYAIFVLDSQGYVRSWNAGAERLKGYRPEEIIGHHFSAFYTPEDIERGWPEEELTRARDAGRFEDEGWRVRKDGTRMWANVIITALRDDQGDLVGFGKVTRDLTERREQEERVRQSEERFRLLIDGVQDYAIYLLDPEGHVSSWNAGAERITGFRASEILGRSFEVFYPQADVAAGKPAAELREALNHRRAEDKGWRVRKDGTRFWADVVVTPLYNARSEHVGFAKVTRDLSERKRMEALEQEGRHVTEFLAMLAHELRNPLAPIRNAVGILAILQDPAPEVAWCRDVIDRQAAQLSRLVDDLLDVSRITRGKLLLQSTPMDLAGAVHRAIEITRPLIESRRHDLEIVVPNKPVIVHGDLTRLAQVFSNLLTNAAKYTGEGGRIRIELGVEGDDAIVHVKDNGQGIAPDLIERVFDLFAQGERNLDRSAGGLGIGLTLARRIAVLHGGTIAAASAGEGRGSTFTVQLPLVHGKGAADPAGDVLASQSRGPRHSILVVDDNTDSGASMAMLLRLMGHDVETSTDGPEALARMASLKPDIVFLDIGLPGMNGYEVAREIRRAPGGDRVHLYAMTGYGQSEDRRRSLEAGFNGHLVKPVAMEAMVDVIDNLPPRG